MSSAQKVKKKKGKSKSKNIAPVEVKTEDETSPIIELTSESNSGQGSSISVKEAALTHKADTVENEDHTEKQDDQKSVSRPQSSKSIRPESAGLKQAPVERANSGVSRKSQRAESSENVIHKAESRPVSAQSHSKIIQDEGRNGSPRPESAAKSMRSLSKASISLQDTHVDPRSSSPRPDSRQKSVQSQRLLKKNVVEPGNLQPSTSQIGSMTSLRSKGLTTTGTNKLTLSSFDPSSLKKAFSKKNAIAPMIEMDVLPQKSSEAWIEDSPSRPMSAKPAGRPSTAVSNIDNQSVVSTTELGAVEMNEAHAYVPYIYARGCIAKIVEDMKRMKGGHIKIVHDIENNYRAIEEETQAQFNVFVTGLCVQYSGKVKTFNQVIDVHRLEVNQKQQYWDEALASLSARNRQLLRDKKVLLVQNKVEFERIEREKREAIKELTQKLDEASITLATLNVEKGDAVKLTEEKFEKEMQELEDNHQKELINAKEQEKEQEKDFEEERKAILEQVAFEKRAKEKLQKTLEELEKNPELAVAVGEIQKSTKLENEEDSFTAPVIVTDMSADDRKKMEAERKVMEKDRASMEKELEQIQKERERFNIERKGFQEDRVQLQGDLVNANKDKDVIEAKYDGLKDYLKQMEALKAQNEALKGQVKILTPLAVASTPEEKEKTQKTIDKVENDKLIMQEEKNQLAKDIKKWEKDFEKKNGKLPTEDDRDESAQEMYTSCVEVDNMIGSLDNQIKTMEQIKEGKVPEIPQAVVAPIEIKEPEIRTVTVRIPDPEVVAHLEMTQEELEAMKLQLTRAKKEIIELKSQISKLTGEVTESKANITKKDALNKELAKKNKELIAKLAATDTNSVAAAGVVEANHDQCEKTIAELRQDLREQRRKFEEDIQQMQLEHDKEIRKRDKMIKSMEKDIEKMIRAYEKLKKKKQNENAKKLLEIVVEQVKDVHGKVNVASEMVEEKLKKANEDKDNIMPAMGKAQKDFDEWQLGWAEENGRMPKLKDREQDKDGRQLHSKLEQVSDKVDDAERLINALNMIATGLVPEKLKKPSEDGTPEAEIEAAEKEVEAANEEVEKLEDNLSSLEDRISELEEDIAILEADKKTLKSNNEELDDRIAELERLLAESKAQAEGLRERVRNLQQEVAEKNRELKEMKIEHDKELREKEQQFEAEIKEYVAKEKDMERDIGKLLKRIDKLQKKLADKKNEEGTDASDNNTDELEEKVAEHEEKISDLEAIREALKEENKSLEDKIADLENDLDAAKSDVARAEEAANVAAAIGDNSAELEDLRERIRELEQALREKEKEHEKELKEKDQEHSKELREKDKEIKEMKRDIVKLLKRIDKLQKKLAEINGAEVPQTGNDNDKEELEQQIEKLEDKVAKLEDQVGDLEADNTILQENNKDLEEKSTDLQDRLDQAETSPSFYASTPLVPSAASDGSDAKVAQLEKEVSKLEKENKEEKAAHETTREELEAMQKQLEAAKLELNSMKLKGDAELSGTIAKMQQDYDNLKKKHSAAETRVKALEKERLKNIPPDTAKEIKELQEKLAALEKENDQNLSDKGSLQAKKKELEAKISSLENISKSQKSANSESERKIKQVKAEKDKELKQMKAKLEKKEAEQEKKIAAQERRIKELEAGAPAGRATTAPKSAAVRGAGGPGDSAAKEKLVESQRENKELAARIKMLEKEIKAAGRTGGGAGGGDADKQVKKYEKLMKEMEKRLDVASKKVDKTEANLKQKEEDYNTAQKEIKVKDQEIEKYKAELGALGRAAKDGVEAATKVKSLEKEVKELASENKSLADNFNTERVLRKKYYNMVEDMKGKIRVYCRVRPMSKSELGRGNYSICKSPDEYSINLETSRGQKDFQFDSIFMPDGTQERVFEDTNNLIQSAVDGYNVCIFAYGQTGSGKTFTIIGDKEQNFPGIAPRSFDRIFELMDENKAKFSFKVSVYMLELYNDRLIDLFSKPGANHEDKLEIKKDKKGMVVVAGSEIKIAKNSKELFALFDEGSKNRHVASTKMNAESSRSHLVVGITIESTNKTSGQVVKGKLSLVDLAGSERAAKTEASAEQLKEAMSINKSLSALGDVISALSSEQSFIPYRNNKLTMLMQDSLGGNAKTLMFVNISPADYNADESVVSLTYASRVKLITNDAQKNSDNKEIARLKGVIAKLKKGENAGDDED